MGLGAQSHFKITLQLEGLIFQGFWAQRPYYIRLLGYFEPQVWGLGVWEFLGAARVYGLPDFKLRNDLTFEVLSDGHIGSSRNHAPFRSSFYARVPYYVWDLERDPIPFCMPNLMPKFKNRVQPYKTLNPKPPKPEQPAFRVSPKKT